MLGGTRPYRILLPPAYAESKTRYPVLYWLTGYEQSSPEREAEFASYVASHDLIVIQAGPVETTGDYPLYIPELIDHVDRTLRTAAGREHRGVTGFGGAGFAAWLFAAKFPDLFASASNFDGPTEASAGPRDFSVEYRQDDAYADLESVRTRLVASAYGPLAFYHRRLDSIWRYTLPGHQTAALDAAALPQTLDFHMTAFHFTPPPPATFTHSDPWPNFSVWGWEVVSSRKQPGFTLLENASAAGFRSSVREWLPDGAVLSSVRLSITSPRIAPPGAVRTVTYIRLRDGNVRRANQKADARGRFTFDLDGDLYEVGIAAPQVPVIAASGYDLVGEPWATAGQPVKLRVRFWNKGSGRFVAGDVNWESPGEAVRVEPASSRLFALATGESGYLTVTAVPSDPAQTMLRLVTGVGPSRFVFDVPLFPAASPPPVFRIADGASVEVYQHAVERTQQAFGAGNGDGHASPGETFAILVPDGEWLRAAELFGANPCIDDSLRGSDLWDYFDRSGASARYSLPTISRDCAPGTPIRMLARILMPDYRYRYYTIQFPVWYAN